MTAVSGVSKAGDLEFGVELRRFSDEDLDGYVMRINYALIADWSDKLLGTLIDRARDMVDPLITVRSRG